MWRAFFLAFGISLFLLGAECVVIEKAILDPGGEAKAATGDENVAPPTAATGIDEPSKKKKNAKIRAITPPDWAPWSLMSAGAVVFLYSFTLPGRKQ